LLTVDFNLFGIRDGDRVLDAGCGEGRHAWEVCREYKCSVCCMDISRESLRKLKYVLYHMLARNEAKGWGNVMLGDALNLPFKDSSFDRIICSEVLEHLTDDEQGIRELVRVLKDGGALVVTVPTYLSELMYWTISKDYYGFPGGHIRRYKTGELLTALRRNQLRVYAIRYEHAFHTIYWLLRCIFGVKNEGALVPSIYHKFLVYQIETKSRFVRLVEGFCNFFFPKSLVIYTRKI